MIFKLLHNNDVQSAYEIICERVNHLNAKGIKQYIRPYPPMELFLERQKKNENFGYYSGKELTGIATLIRNYIPEGWSGDINGENFLWLTTLFISLRYKGNKYGSEILEKIHVYAVKNKIKEIYLDCYCGDGFLEKYYNNFGYKSIKRKIVQYPARSFEALLMKKEIIEYQTHFTNQDA